MAATVFQPTLQAEILPIKNYTAADGIGSSSISYLTSDSRGFLWFCTRDGLSRFDGQRFVTYRVGAAKDSPPGIEQIIETRQGIYWIATTAGLYRYDPQKPLENQILSDNAPPSLSAEWIGELRGALFEDSAGRLWIGGETLHQVVERDGKFTFQKIELELPLNPAVQFTISGIAEGADKSLWIVTSQGYVRILPDGRKVFYRIGNERADSPNSILPDTSGRIWLARVSGVYVLKPETAAELPGGERLIVRSLDEAAKPMLATGDVRLPNEPGEMFRFEGFTDFMGGGTAKFLHETRDRHVWVSAGNGVIEFDGRRFTEYTVAQGFIKGGGQFAEDAAGNLWMGRANGLIRLNRGGLTRFGAADGIKGTATLALGTTVDGALFTGDEDFNIYRFNGARFDALRPPLPPKARAMWMSRPIFQDSAGEWWFLTFDKLYRFAAGLPAVGNARLLAEYDTNDGFRGDSMFQIFEDREKNLWISNRGPNAGQSGLARWTRADERFYFFSEADGMPPNKAVSAFAEDAAGNRWFGFYEGGLAKFSHDRFARIPGSETGGVVTALYFDKRGRLWMTSSLKGLTLIENADSEQPTLRSYTTENGLTSNNARSIAEDDFGQLYVGTARGVDRFSPETGQIKHYTTNDGLAGDFVNLSFRAGDGSLWFGTPNGLARLVPQPEIQAAAPPVWLSGLRVAGERRAISELGAAEISELELQPSQNNLQIDFFGIDFNPNESLRYQFMLEGADADWSQPSEQRSVNYANLSAGDYRFLVRAVGAGGGASQNPARVSFRILRPVWQRWWFLTLLTLAVAGVIYIIYSYRLRRLVELERVRTRIATDLHDDIGASLSKIAILTEVVHQRISPVAPESREINQPLDEIAGTSRELVDSMSDIVWAINPERDHLSDLLQRMRNLAGEMTELADIGLHFHASNVETIGEMSLGADLRREIYLIFKETINNLVKHSRCERAEIEFARDNDFLIVTVKDDGKGFIVPVNGKPSTSGKLGGNGLPNMRRRAASLGGSYEILSEIGKGTTTILRVPLKSGWSLLNYYRRN